MKINEFEIKVIVPTYNAGEKINDFIEALLGQDGLKPNDVIAIDSSSADGTAEKLRRAGFDVKVIAKEDFGHGRTRHEAVQETEADLLVFLTQDAVLAEPCAIKKLLSAFTDPTIAAAYGRQLPYPDASPFGAFARLFNYGEKDIVNAFADRKKRGIKTAFLSDSFAAYRREALLAVGNFDKEAEFSEDAIAAAKLLMAGYKTKYCADAKVYHSHNYSIREEYERYKCIGITHAKYPWLLETFGKAEGEGIRFVLEEIRYLSGIGKMYLIPLAIIRNIVKYIGYKIGQINWLGVN